MATKQLDREAILRGVDKGQGDPAKYLRLIARGFQVGKAKILSGYARNYSTTRILATARGRTAVATVAAERTSLCTTPGSTLRDSVEFNMEIRDNDDIDPKIRLSADNNIASRLGHNAPAQVEVQERGLYMHLHSYNSNEIQQAIDAQSGNNRSD